MIRNFYKYKPGLLDIIWDIIIHVIYFIAYIIITLVGLCLLALAQRDSSLGYAFSGLLILGLVIYQIFLGGFHLARGIYSGLRNSNSKQPF
jgi:hypothetical protein